MEKIGITGTTGTGIASARALQDEVGLVEQNSEEIKYLKPQPVMDPGINYTRLLFGENSIPPKVYGMNYVKRGTHKRTNKR